MRPIIYYTIYDSDIVCLKYDNSVDYIDYDNYSIIRLLFCEQYLYKRYYQAFLIGV